MATLSKNLILPKEMLKNEGVVILPLKKYEEIKEKMREFSRQKKILREEAETLKIITEGEKEYKERKLKPIKSLAELK
jgi:hypothetical protein